MYILSREKDYAWHSNEFVHIHVMVLYRPILYLYVCKSILKVLSALRKAKNICHSSSMKNIIITHKISLAVQALLKVMYVQ